MRNLRITAALCGALLAAGVAATPAQAASPEPLRNSLSSSPDLKQQSAPSVTAQTAGDCAPKIVKTTQTPRQVKMGVSDVTTTITFRVGLLDECNVVGSLYMNVDRTSGAYHDEGYMDWETGYPASDGLYYAVATTSANPYDLSNDLAGTWSWDVQGYSWPDEWDGYEYPNTSVAHGPAFYLQRWSRLTVNAAPEPVRKGQTLTVTGLLDRASWNDLRYYGLGGAAVTLQKRSFTGSYTTVTTLTTDAAGRVSYKTLASADVCYRLVFPGYTTTAAVTSGGDCVDVV